jgi:hypothetical protein
LLTGCAGTSQTTEELTQEEETAQSPQEEAVADPIDYVCSEVTSALNAASTSFQEGLADAEYETAERMDFYLKMQALTDIYENEQSVIQENAELASITEVFAVAQRISTQVNDESFDFFQVQEMLSGGLALVAEACPDAWSASETESLFLMIYGDGAYKLELPEQASDHFSTDICDIVAAEIKFPDNEYQVLSFGQLVAPFGTGRTIESGCTLSSGGEFGQSAHLQIIEFQSDADQMSFLKEVTSQNLSIGQVFRAEGTDVYYRGPSPLRDDFFEALGFQAMVSP